MEEAKRYRVRFEDEGGAERVVTCYGVLEQLKDRIRIGDCIFQERVIISLTPVEDEPTA